jgi:excisionase family DNA binding protein
MNTLTENRLDASLLTEKERASLPLLLEMFRQGDHPSLKAKDGTEIPLPEHIFQMLVKVVEEMRRGRAIVLMPEDEAFTTQAAANYLGMSRQYLVKLLEGGEIPFHRVGSHRRVTFKDLRTYEKRRDADRRKSLGGLFSKLQQEGYYDTDYTGDIKEGDAR